MVNILAYKDISGMSSLSRQLIIFLTLITFGCSQHPQKRVVVLGLDGLTPQLLFPWIEEGELPAFQSLKKTGSYGILNSTLPPSSAPAWTSCITGVGPGRHGIYGFIRLFGQAWDRSPSPGLSFNSSMSNDAKTIWEILGSIGKRTIAINVPLTSPPFEINGIMIAGFPHPEKAPLTYPEAFESELSDYRPDVYGIHVKEGKEEEFLSDVYDISRRRELLALKLFDENDWDLFFVVFTIPDRIQHYFWKYMDQEHPLYTEESGSIYCDEIKKVYQWVDGILGEFMNRLDDDTSLIVMSDHGFRVVKKQVNGKVVLSEVNDDSMFVAYPTDNFGAKYRVKPRYTLMKNDETEARRKHFIERAINHLRTLEDPQSGTTIIEKIFTKGELFRGPHFSAAPDIIAIEREGYLFLNLVKRQGMTLIQEPPDPGFFSGFHQEEGIVLMKGEEISECKEISGMNILDIAPTILAMMGVPLEEEMEGSPITEAFKAIARNNILSEERSSYNISVTERNYILGDEKYSDSEVEKQLKSIGYIR